MGVTGYKEFNFGHFNHLSSKFTCRMEKWCGTGGWDGTEFSIEANWLGNCFPSTG